MMRLAPAKPFPRTALGLLLVALAACEFSPEISSGSLACGAGRACPPGYLCKAAGVCCAPGDEQGPCATAADAGAGSLAAADAADAPDAPADDAASPAPDAAPDLAPDAETPPPPVAKRLVTGAVDLIGYANACTQARASAQANRWCAFTRGRQLWVLDVTAALTRDVPCDGSDPGCLLLTSTLATGPGLVPEFQGDTLIFPAEPLASEDMQFRGGLFAWLPGWPGAQRLTSANGVHCEAAPQAASAWCLDRVAGGRFELRVGPLAPAPALIPVKSLATPEVYGSLSSDGSSFLLDEPGKGAARSLSIMPIADPTRPGAAVQIASEVERGWWTLSGDGAYLFLLRANTGGEKRVSGTLSVFDLVQLMGPGDLAERVGWFEPLAGPGGTSLGVAVLQDLVGRSGVLKLFLNVSPFEVNVGPSSVSYAVSSDGRFTVFTPTEDPGTTLHDARVADHAAGSVCALQIRPQTHLDISEAFSENGELVFWHDFPDDRRDAGDGWMARSAGCAVKQKFATRLLVHHVLRDRGLLYVDEYTPASGGTLRVVSWQAGMSWPSTGAAAIQDGVDGQLTVIEPERKIAVFTSRQSGRAGLYAVKLPM
jgi:hypothetical protein